MKAAAFLAALALLTSPGIARADDDEATRHFNAGRDHVRSNRCDLAVGEFRASQAAKPNVGALLNIGECLEKLNVLDEAYDAFRDAQALAAERRDSERATFAKSGAERIEAMSLRVAPKIDETPTALEVDGKASPRRRWSNLILRPKEVHRLVAKYGGKPEVVREVSGRPGERVEVDLAPAALAKDAAPGPPPPRSGIGGVQIAGLVVSGAGVLAIGTGLVLGLVASGARDDVSRAIDARHGAGCTGSYPDAICDPSARGVIDPLVDSARSWGNLSTIVTTSGAVLIVAGVAMYVFGANKATQTTARRFDGVVRW